MLARNDVITKVDEQQHNRVKGRIAAGVALDEQAEMQVVAMQGDGVSVVDEQHHDSGEGKIATGVALVEQDVDRANGAITDDHHVDKAKRNVLHVQDNAANGRIVDGQQDVSALAGLIGEQQNDRIQCSVVEDQLNDAVEGVIYKGVIECAVAHE